jgi:hypothetical protein
VLKTPPSLFNEKFAAVLRRFDIFSGKEIYALKHRQLYLKKTNGSFSILKKERVAIFVL